MSGQIDHTCRWVYEGVWGVLAEWFRVPRDPPSLPVAPGEQLERRRPSVGFLQYLKFQFWIALVAIDVALTAGWIVLIVVWPLMGLLITPLACAIIIVPDIIAYVAIHLRYDTTWYVLTDRSLRIRRGVWTIQETTITFENIQNISVRQGPLQRWFGISDLVVETAGGGGGAAEKGVPASSHVGLMEGISDAAELRDAMLVRLRQSRHAGLGDDTLAVASTESAWSLTQLARLREIRDLAVRLGR